MSPRTYIGPFGRILPLRDEKEPERQKLPISALDETRTNINMATYQLPPPERLQFGSDISPGFTEPIKYNTISQSGRVHGSSPPLYVEPPWNTHHKPLPSVSQLLTPSTQKHISSSPSSSPQRSPNSSRPPTSGLPNNRESSFNQRAQPYQYPHQPTYPQVQSTTQMRFPTNVSLPREGFPINSSTSRFPSSYGDHQGPSMSTYASSLESTQQALYPSQSQRVPPALPRHQSTSGSNASHSHPMLPIGVAQSQYMPPLNGPITFQGQTSAYQMTPNPATASEHISPTPANKVKPQPRVIAERDIPGEGPSWVYEDGTTCKKVIDGEVVNAQWGVTKAGKPRKRLAIACTTCREKKIKCDPAEPKCVQCEKFGRDCKFTTA